MSNPYPGLRPFQYEESYLFFGRDGQSEDLLKKLDRSHFVGVVGTSGSGKSSLVRAGLLPLLSSGFMPNTGSDWRVAVFRPGDNPIHNLAHALVQPGYSEEGQSDDPLKVEIAETVLRRSAIGLPDYVSSEDFDEDENLLIVVDQFEELFRFERESGLDKPDEEAAAFVKLLLEAAKDKSGKIYVVITMRSDFLGDCARFRDLPEAINDGQYLIPRLTRNELRQVIESPAKVHGANISPGLVTHLLNEIGDDQDQLPVLQHALMRTWDHWEQSNDPGSDIEFEDYHATGGMKEALSIHADEAFAGLNELQQGIAEKMFKTITEIDRENRETRRATSLERICAIADAQIDEVIPVIEAYRAPGRTFLMPPHQVQLNKDSLIDISHESLIRKWKRLHDWVDEEAESAQIYRRLAEDALLHSEGKAGFWAEPGLANAVEWREKFKPNSEWADLYYKSWGTRTLASYDETLGYLDESKRVRDHEVAEEQRLKNRKIRRLTVYFALMSLMTLAMVVVAGWAFVVQKRATEANESATKALVARYVESGRQELANNYPFRAAVYLSEAYKTSNDPTLQLLLARAMRSVETLESSFEHEDDVYSATFSPDGTRLLTAGDHELARVWDLKTRKIDFELKHYDDVNAAEFSPDGKLIVTGSDDGSATIWDSASGKQKHTLVVSEVEKEEEGEEEEAQSGDDEIRSAIRSAKFSPDGSLVMVGRRNEVVIFDAETGNSVSTIRHGTFDRRSPAELQLLRTAEFSPNSDLFLTVHQDNTARVWDVRSGRARSTLKHGAEVLSAGFSADQKHLITTSAGDVPKVWEVGSSSVLFSLKHVGAAKYAEFGALENRMLTTDFGKLVKISRAGSPDSLELEHRENIRSARFAPDGRTVVTIDVGNVARIWDATTGRILTSFQHQNDIYSARFSADGKKVATASADKSARVWTTDSKNVLKLPDQGPEIRVAVFSKNGKELITTSFDNKVRIRNAATGEVLRSIVEGEEVIGLEVSDSGERILTTLRGGRSVSIWDTASGKRLNSFDSDASDLFLSAVFSPEGNSILTATNGTVALRNIATGKVSNILKGEKVLSATFSKDGSKIAIIGEDIKIRFYDANTLAKISVIEIGGAFDNLDLSQDGKFFVVFTGMEDNAAVIWSIETGKQVASLRHEDDINNVIFSASDNRVITMTDKTVYLWDHTWKKVLVSFTHNEKVTSAKLLGDLLLTASGDASAIIWDMKAGKSLVSIANSNKRKSSIEPKRSALFSPDGNRVFAYDTEGSAVLWNVSRETRPYEEIERIVSEKVPYRLDNGVLIPKNTE